MHIPPFVNPTQSFSLRTADRSFEQCITTHLLALADELSDARTSPDCNPSI
jgi:hypothetical protein